jgi:ABC-type nitrate/sulfonate/bicarbonate transport system substrate-binding protein
MAAVCVAVLLAGCGGAASAPSSSVPAAKAHAAQGSTAPASSSNAAPAAQGGTSSSAGLTKVVVASPAPFTLSSTPYLVADKVGIFKKLGLQVTLEQVKSSIEPEAAINNQIDTFISTTDMLNGAVRGLKVKDVMDLFSEGPWVLIGHKSITSVAALKGQPVAISGYRTTPYWYLRAALQKAGLKISDVKLVTTGQTVNTMDAVLSGRVAAGVVTPPFDVIADSKGQRTIEFLGTLLNVPYAGVDVADSEIQQHPNRLKKLLEGLVQAVAYIRANPSVTEQVMEKDFKTTPAEAAGAYKILTQIMTTNGGKVSPVSLKNYLQELSAQVKGANKANVSNFYTDSLLPSS